MSVTKSSPAVEVRPTRAPRAYPTLTDSLPIRAELLGSDDLEACARDLAKGPAQVRSGRPLLPRFFDNGKTLRRVHRVIAEAFRRHELLTTDAEWLIDNYHVVADALREVQEDLPRTYYRELPKRLDGPMAGLPRVYELAVALIAHTDAALDEATITRFVQAYQQVAVLTIGELWAVPIMLRAALLENLRRLGEQILSTWQDRSDASREAERLLAANDQAMPVVPPLRSDAFAVQLLTALREHGAPAGHLVERVTQALPEPGTSPADLLARENHRQASNQLSVGNSVTSLRLLSALDWHVFFEKTSLVEAALRDDPAGAYARQEFASGDRYRRAVEQLARGSERPELEVARRAIHAAEAARAEGAPRDHVGYYLVGEGRRRFARELGYRAPLRGAFTRAILHYPRLAYFAAVGLLTLLLYAGMLAGAGSAGWALPVLFLALLPASDLAIALVHFLVTQIVPPRVLPRLEFKDGVPVDAATFVVMPSMLLRPESAQSLFERLEIHYLANPDANLYFALLTDFADAPAERMPEDESYLQAAIEAARLLNERYARGGPARFYLFHRRRLWNPGEGCWMGWERKRGKLAEFNRLLRGARDTSFTVTTGNLEALPRIHYVITLDADTQLPGGAARRLVATLAHPLNQARIDERSQRVVEGYGILQPRVSLRLASASRSFFSRLFSRSAGIDPYVTAVSDVYQDLFGIGSFTGKGIYDVDAFEAATGKRFGENTILSHDLIEGNFARCGLVTDIELYDDFPARYHAYARREHRWVRGDWQLLPWLFRPGMGIVERWKVLDNLRRSLVPPCLILLLVLGWLVLPGSPWLWSGIAFAVVSAPVWLQVLGALVAVGRGRFRLTPLIELRLELPYTAGQVLLNLIFLADQARLMVDAIGRTLGRLCCTRRHLLEWETAASTERRLSDSLPAFWAHMWPAPATALALGVAVAALRLEALPAALPFLLLWLASPVVAFLVSRPLATLRETPLTPAETRVLRVVARKTWSFFETFIGDQDHWLPPDNYQEDPKGVVAHRTSPTNIGLLLLSTLSAHDLGYLSRRRMLERLEKTFDMLEKLDRYQGHFDNWYDTQTLQPLQPTYVSTVDSGNLLGCLLTLKHGLLEKSAQVGPDPAWREGLLDTLEVVEEYVRDRRPDKATETPEPLRAALAGCRKSSEGIPAAPTPEAWESWLREFDTHAEALLHAVRDLGDSPSDLETWAERLLALVRERRAELHSSDAESLAERCDALATRAAALAGAMNFRFLYDRQMHLFAIGFNRSTNALDNSHYDLLASEASLTSFLAIARGDADRKHWFQLGRPVTRAAGYTALVSWGGTMFEYLMPRLLLQYYPGTLLDESCRGAVARQIEYGRQTGVPWGVSESGFAALDVALDYQYKSFGVPGLGIKRGLARDLVIAPYATALAAMIDPRRALENFRALRREGGAGPHGFYEAIDYTRDRLLKKRRSLVVKSFMAHHQGMALVALADSVLGDRMPRRLRAEPMVRATELLLQERVPRSAPLLAPEIDEAAVARAAGTASTPPMTRRLTTPQTPAPRTHLLSNGRYHVMMTNAGGGFSRFDALDVTRWREDRTCDPWGQFLYIHDLAENEYWSAGFQPVCREADEYEVLFAADKVDLRRIDGDIETLLEVAVSPENSAEVRRLTLTNRGRRARDLEITSYAEVVLAPAGADAAHPAFGKLFLETEFLESQQALLCRRRPRSHDQKPVYAIHALACESATRGSLQYETDRARFLGRNRTPARPAALDPGATLSGTTGPVLDPIFSLRRRVRVLPGQSVALCFMTGVAETREEALTLAGRFADSRAATRTFELAWAHSQVEFRHLNVSPEEAHLFQRLASGVLYAGAELRAAPERIAGNRQGQSGLWRHGISGDLPIVLVQVGEPDELPLVQQMLAAHAFWRHKGLTVDLVLLNEHPGGYFEQLQEQLQNLVRSSEAGTQVGRPGGVFLLRASHLNEEDRRLLEACARLVISGQRGSLVAQVERRESAAELPPLLAARASEPARGTPPGYAAPEELRFFNGFGGFSSDGREYVIFPTAHDTATRRATPAPWINVIANPTFGCLVSETGAGYTWQGNSQTNRLTPWSNDPVSDPPGEALFLRDEASGAFWRVPSRAECRHGQGYTLFRQHQQGIAAELCIFVAADAPVKVLRLRVRNDSPRSRNLSATFFAEWVLGTLRSANAMHVVTEVDEASGLLCARNAYNPDFPTQVAFVDVNRRPRTWTADRTEFLGRNGSIAAPAALTRVRLSGRVGAALDPCAAVQTAFEVPSNSDREVVFILGQAASVEEARSLAQRFREPAEVQAAFTAVTRPWNELLESIQVKTPDPGFDLLLNRWLLYQVLGCRVWARSAFYQSGGAFGFRDQLQDVMALVYGAPGETRAQILRAASRQFKEGDVQHWWHPPSGKGVRTRFSDDLLWLPFVVCHYIQTTGDRAILDERVPYLEAPLLAPDQEEVYGQPAVSTEVGTIYEHCTRALDRGCHLGAHNLPLMGTGDWNDGMNKVGAGGKGESVWNAWFLLTILRPFATLAHERGDAARRDACLTVADILRTAVEANAWDGAWYRRAYFDDGTPLGSRENDECQIDAIVQTWAVLSQSAIPARAKEAMAAFDERLVRRAERMILLFTPPFDQGPLQPGYIKGYVPGIRENGGQYTHAATWAVQAAAMLGDGDRAVEYFDLLNPIRHADTPEGVERYKTEPYVVVADIYSQPPHVGRGGWTWYTGSAGWLYRVGLEAILGIHLRGNRLEIDPRIARSWPAFEVHFRHRAARYHITVANPAGVEHGVRRILLDGAAVDGMSIALQEEGEHTVQVEMG